MKHLLIIVILFFMGSVPPVLAQKNAVPEWARGAVWYQIFPERFSNGDTANDPRTERVFMFSDALREGWKPRRWTSNWFERDEWEKTFTGNFGHALSYRRYGGDFRGLLNKLDYIKSLGVTAIYLNPVFDAVSSHKYDGSTFHHMDIYFGPDPAGDARLIASEKPDDPSTWQWTSADKLFLQFLKEAKARGLRVILDGVFNHSGTQFWAFQDIVSRGRESKYFDWYQIKTLDDPATPDNEFDYKGWWNVKSLPEFSRTAENIHPGVKAYIFSATRKWMDPDGDGNPMDGIDGWRLDVAKELPLGFWNEWSAFVRKANSQALIIGELWELSPDFVKKGGAFDGLMNYPFATAVNTFFIKDETMTAPDFIAALKKIDETYPDENLDVLQNLMDSHDTERLISMVANPGREYGRDADGRNPAYNPGKPTAAQYDRQKLIAAFQFLYRGSPMIYYGDEVGMWGANDPHCRKPMVWDELLYDNEVIGPESGFSAGHGKYPVKIEKTVLAFYRRLAAMRKMSSALRYGKTEFLQMENDRVLGFTRTFENEKVVVFFNLSERSEIIQYPVAGKEVIDMMIGDSIKLENAHLQFPLWGRSFAAYLIK